MAWDAACTECADSQAHAYRQQGWLALLRHAAACLDDPGRCHLGGECAAARLVLQHLQGCSSAPCSYPHCAVSKAVLQHHRVCRALRSCATCSGLVARMRDLASPAALAGKHARSCICVALRLGSSL